MLENTFSLALLGFVVIGRNEGERLKASLNAIRRLSPNSPVVYVDSGSTDQSVSFSRGIGVDVVELDMSLPFTAARARNAGGNRLLEQHPDLEFVQFFDGDCEMTDGWVDAALSCFERYPEVGIVSGRRREKFPEASIYNTLMDIEWNTPIGECFAVPGDMCVKTAAFKAINGFNPSIIAAEDNDFCLRAYKAGHKIRRVDADMSRHDANITHLAQWYKRAQRGGHGFANIHHIHDNGSEKHFRKELRSIAFWGATFPVLLLICMLLLKPLAGLMVLTYLLFIAKTFLRRKLSGDSLRIALAYSALTYTGKVAEFFGVIAYWKNHLLERDHTLIEYK